MVGQSSLPHSASSLAAGSSTLAGHARQQLQALSASHLLRAPRRFQGPQGTTLRQAQPGAETDRELVNFSSNDYLGLANHPKLIAAAQEALSRWGIGAGASRLVCGTLAPHILLEQRLAVFKGTEAALSFSSGYAAAVGVIPALVGTADVIILDKLCHASLVDGARLSGANLRIFPHNHTGKLREHLAWARRVHPTANVLVLVESVYSMDGDVAPLAEIVRLKQEYGAWLLVDEAHAMGVLGQGGRGLVGECDPAAGVVDLQMGTFSKALGVSGGYLCADRATVDLLVNRARSFVFSTAPPPALAAAALAGLELVQSTEGQQLREQLWDNVDALSRVLASVDGVERAQPASAILPWIVGGEARALAVAEALFQQGILVPAIRYPTVARGQARLRFTASATHTKAQLALLRGSLTQILQAQS